MATLTDFAHQLYPGHVLSPWESSGSTEPAPLAAHTVVAEVIGAEKARRVYDELRRVSPAEVRAVDVRPSSPTVMPTEHEDPGGPVDVPKQRQVVGGVAGAVIGAIVLGVLALIVVDSTAGRVIATVFGLGLGAAVGIIVSSGRHAGPRATIQADDVHGRRISLLAVMLDDEQEAVAVVGAMEAHGVDKDIEYRIVGTDGGWHVPST